MKLLMFVTMSLATMFSMGCGGSGGGYTGPTGSMTGKVSINGATPPDGTVMVLIHKEAGSATSTKIQADGTYSVTNVRVGDYMVGFSNPKTAAAAEMDPDAAMKAIEDGKYVEPPAAFPQELMDPSSSGITVTVKEGQSSFDIQI